MLSRTVRMYGLIMVATLSLLAGCASVPMQKAETKNMPANDKALVTFVRPSIFFGDGVSFDLWDGEKYLGAMKSGTIVQYEAEPGKHLFMAQGENWSYVTAELVAGRRYFIKCNLYPGFMTARVSLGVVPNNDERITTWLNEYKAMAPDSAKAQQHALDNKKQVTSAIEEFNAGKVTSFDTIKSGDGM